MAEKNFAIALHGGAGTIRRDLPAVEIQRFKAGLSAALALGQAMLETGAAAVDVVEAVVKKLEDNPLFNAARGGVLNSAGVVEMDAAIMDGSTRRCGGVTGVTTVKNPVGLARLVMELTPHVLMTGQGAEALAQEFNVERADGDYFRTPQRVEQWRAAQARRVIATDMGQDLDDLDEGARGTVGCVVRDHKGRLAAGTSTGGMTNKLPGRSGDTPLIGCGTFADERCAVSCTGQGEEFIRHVVAHSVAALMEHGGKSLDEAAQIVIHQRLKAGDGGLIAVDRDGHISMPFNTVGMFRAAANAMDYWEVSIWPPE
jgi:beta-aspartyl-peptidase (threonine type)